MCKKPNFELDSAIMYGEIPDKVYQCEMEISNRWQSFGAELLRLSILGIAIFGFLYQHFFSTFKLSEYANDFPINFVKNLSLYSVCFFALSTVFALIFIYGNTQALTLYISGARNPSERKSKLKCRDKLLTFCFWAKILSSIGLAIGTVLSTITIVMVLNGRPPNPPDASKAALPASRGEATGRHAPQPSP